MKKAYERPLLLVERFELTQRLSNCSLLIGFQDRMCVLQDDDSTVSMRNMAVSGYFTAQGCTKYPMNQDADEGVCYHTSVNLVFSS